MVELLTLERTPAQTDFEAELEAWKRSPEIEDPDTRKAVNHVGCMADIAMERAEEVAIRLEELMASVLGKDRQQEPKGPTVRPITPPLCGHSSEDGICRTTGCRHAYCGLKTIPPEIWIDSSDFRLSPADQPEAPFRESAPAYTMGTIETGALGCLLDQMENRVKAGELEPLQVFATETLRKWLIGHHRATP